MRFLVTGGGGFIGSNLVDALLSHNYKVRAIDNFVSGHQAFLETAMRNSTFELISADLLDSDALDNACNGVDIVIHLAANADVRFGWLHPRLDVEQNVLATQNLLESMRRCGVKKILFSSTGSVYGKSHIQPTPEDAPFPVQTSLYGASKLAAEALISAYVEAGHFSATIFRFVSILGPRYTHGHVIDFVAQLLRNPEELRILGNGSQRKSYLHISDCVSALINRSLSDEGLEILNLGHDDYCTVADSAGWIAERLGLAPRLEFGTSIQGWVGDNPFIHLDNSKIKQLGWAPSRSIRSSIEDTVDWLMANQWAVDLAILEK